MAQGRDYAAIKDRAVSEVALNCRTGPLVPTWSAHQLNDNGPIKPGQGPRVSTITVVTLTEYTVALTGDTVGTTDMDDPTVIIPVKSAWTRKDWLVPYILSFTTTGWWNHSAYMSSRFINTTTGQTNTDWSAKYLAQSCLPVLEGQFDKIMLVVVNKTGPNVATQDFTIPGPNGSLVLHYGQNNEDFAEHVYEWLGIQDHNVPIPDMTKELAAGWTHLIETIAVDGVVTKAVSTVAELTRTRWNGSLVKSSPNIGENEHHGILLAPNVLNEDQALAINGEDLHDLNADIAVWADINPRLSVLTCWRSTPLCQMHKSVMYLGNGNDHQANYPTAAGWSESVPEYTVAES